MATLSSKTKTENMGMYKNKLQEITQKQRLALPSYRAANEGFPHAPKFRASVFVDGAEYTSKSTYHRLREAEQEAAKLAYECILSNAKQNGLSPTLNKEQKSSKSTLHELTFKNHGALPKYKTVMGKGEGSLPVYVSSVTVTDKTFTGDEAGSKKDAEQLAAETALEFILGTDSEGIPNLMASSKRKNYGVNSYETNQKKIKNMGAEGRRDASQVKRVVTTSAPRSSTPVNRPVLRKCPDAQRVRIGLGNAVQGATLANRKMQQRNPFS